MIRQLAAGFAAFILLFTALYARAQNNKTADDLDGKAEYAYVLTMERFSKLEAAHDAVGEWADRNEQTSENLEKDKLLLEGTLAEKARILDGKYPEFTAIIRKHDLSTQEYLLGTRVEVHALLLLDARKHGETKGFAKNVNPANLAFVEQHQEEIRKNIRFKI